MVTDERDETESSRKVRRATVVTPVKEE